MLNKLESQNASNCHEQGRFVYRYSGNAIGTFYSKIVRPVIPGVAHALFYDQTHDNPPPYEVNKFVFYFLKCMINIFFCRNALFMIIFQLLQ